MYLFSKSTLSFYPKFLLEDYKESGTLPSDVVEVSEEQFNSIMRGKVEGKVVAANKAGEPILRDFSHTKETLAIEERVWRDAELKRADVELLRVQDGEPDARGTVGEWRNYRKELRAWPEHADFPNRKSRPVAPDKEIKG